MFHLRALGCLTLQSDSAAIPVAASQRRRLMLLVALARAGDRGISRERLLALLWAENTEESARHALDQLLYTSRRDLDRQVIRSEGGQLRLNAKVVWSDVADFEAHLQRDEWELAVDLYGGPFLHGIHLGASLPLERWVEVERARLEERFLEALVRLAHAAAEQGDLRAALAWRRRRVAAEPFSGPGAIGLMQAFEAVGDRGGALRYAHTYAALVRAELGGEPNADILALTKRLTLAPEPPLRPPSHWSPSAEGPTNEHSRDDSVGDHPTPDSHQPPSSSSPSSAAEVGGAALPLRPRWFTIRSRPAALLGGLILVTGLWGVLVLGLRHPASRPATVDSAPGAGQFRPTVSPETPDPMAHALYLRGRMAWNHRSREGLREAVVLFRQATERDPSYAMAYAGLAEAYVMLGYLGFIPGEASFPKGKAAALQALALDSTMGQAYAAVGVALQWERRWADAEQAFVRALEYAPENATAHQWYALLLTILGRRHEAVTHGRRAAELDPLSIQVHNTYGILLYHAGALDSALHVYERMVTSEPDTAWVRQNPWVLSNFGTVAAAAGRHKEAVGLIERAARVVPGHPRPMLALAGAYLTAGDPTQARAAFDRADPDHPHYALYRGLLHARRGEMDATFHWLGRVQEWSPVLLIPLIGDPALDGLRADPRFAQLRRRLLLPDRR